MNANAEYTFRFERSVALPALAWCAKIEQGAPVIVVEHGAGVETRSDGFVEGVWNGSFVDAELASAGIVLGSGGTLHDGRVAFTPTTHTMERLYSLRVARSLFVSNSLPYLVAATGSRLDMHDWSYERDLMTFLRGYKRAARELRLAEGRRVAVHYHQTLLVNRQLEIEQRDPPRPPRFHSYNDYVDYLVAMTRMLHANATAAERQLKFTPLATISSGYDSPACAVLAKHIGCSRAVTFVDARKQFSPRVAQLDDSGEEIGAQLGFEVEKFSRTAYLAADDFPEAPFLATGNGGDDVILSALGERLAGSMLFTGILGDTLWNAEPTQPPALSEEFRFRYPAGGSMQEFRLATGFVHVPIPLLTFVRHADIARVSGSEEMRPWRVGGEYDRPIPRRLVEEHGVKRDAFAKEKRAITQPFWLQRATRSSMTERSLSDFEDFRTQVAASYAFGAKQLAAIEIGRRALYKLRRGYAERSRDPYYSPAYMFAATAEPLRFHWAVDKMLERYRTTALGRPATHLG